MSDENTRKVNEIIAKGFLACGGALVVVLALAWVKIFNFPHNVIITIFLVGVPTTFVPIILFKVGVPDRFLKSYMLVMMSLLIGLLGTQSAIGIYITYVLVPIASCLYLSYRFTLFISILSYFTMMFGVYHNCGGKFEVTHLGMTQWQTFVGYMLGFTVEYVCVMIFLLKLVSRSEKYFRLQQENIRMQQLENERQRKVTNIYMSALEARRATVFDSVSSQMDNFSTEDFVKMAAGHRFVSTLQDMLKESPQTDETVDKALQSVGDYFELQRILYIEPDYNNEGKPNKMSYCWTKQDKYKLQSFYSRFDENDFQVISAEYDKKGYIILNPYTENEEEFEQIDCGLTRYIRKIMIGPQAWLPTISGGNYTGAMCFERIGKAPFSLIDVFILSDIVTAISLFVFSINAEKANRAKSAFLSTMSHEIRTPMNAILGMSAVALREDINDNARKSLNIIKSSAEGLLSIINDILDFSKIESGRVELVAEEYRTLALINDVKTIADTRNLDKKLNMKFHIPEDLPTTLKGDMVRIKQVMVNFVNNAIKYTDFGSVDVFVSCEKMADDSAILQFRVEDTGQGIKDEDKGKLFMSFSQVNKEQNHHKEGTGLGLAISKQLVNIMGGSIGFDSQYGEGSMFMFAIPQEIVDESPAGALDDFDYEGDGCKQEEQFTAPNANVLIVDDNSVNRMVVEALFSVFKMHITLAEGGREAVNLSRENKYDIIFMDYLMPDMNGIEATQAIRQDNSNINHDTTIVALTADAMNDVKEMLLNAGMDDFLTKPIDIKAATAVLRKYLQ